MHEHPLASERIAIARSHHRASSVTVLSVAWMLASCDDGAGPGATLDAGDATVTVDVRDATISSDAYDATVALDRLDADRIDVAPIDRDVPFDHVEPDPGTPGGACTDGGPCAAHTQCNGARCAWCGGLGELPCAGACREGAPRYGVCFDDTTPSGTLGGLCHLEDCTPGSCSVPDGRDFVCFACGEAPGQPCCPSVGCTGPGLHCTDDVCH